MNMKIMVSISLLIVATIINAQSLTLTMNGEPLGDTVEIFPDDETIEHLAFYAEVNNNYSHDVNVKIARSRIYLAEDAVDYFCWGACYPPFVDTSGVTFLITPGSSSPLGDNGFVGHYDINGSTEVSWIKYSFFNVYNPGEKVDIIAKYNPLPTGIDESNYPNLSKSIIYPNPASNKITIAPVTPNTKVCILDLNGNTVFRSFPGESIIPVSALPSGIYIVEVSNNMRIIETKKLIIQ